MGQISSDATYRAGKAGRCEVKVFVEGCDLSPENVSLSKLFQCERAGSIKKSKRVDYALGFKQGLP